MDAYEKLESLGEGSFGRVYRGRRRFTGQFVALKLVPKANKSQLELEALQREVRILTHLDHPNIIKLLDYFETPSDVVLVMEYAHGELFEVLQSDGALPESTVCTVAKGLTSALAYLHTHRVMHRDLKPQNCLLGSGGVVKLCDFGFARELGRHSVMLSSIKGTPLYMAPEMFKDERYTPSADVWGLGVLLYELAAGKPPYIATNLQDLLTMIVEDKGVEYPPKFSPPLVSFLSRCLVKDPKGRAEWGELMGMPFIAH